MTTAAGRRSGESTAREDILAAARELFSESGFTATTLRAVAGRAGVDVALVPYYFTNKRGLFIAAMALPVDPAQRIAEAAKGTREGLGLRLTTAFVRLWDDAETGPTLQAFLRSAVSDPAAAQSFGEFASQAILPLVADETGLSIETAMATSSMLLGLATMRYVLAAPTYAEPDREALITLYAPRVQALLDLDV